jgi:hypothetical protein
MKCSWTLGFNGRASSNGDRMARVSVMDSVVEERVKLPLFQDFWKCTSEIYLSSMGFRSVSEEIWAHLRFASIETDMMVIIRFHREPTSMERSKSNQASTTN